MKEKICEKTDLPWFMLSLREEAEHKIAGIFLGRFQIAEIGFQRLALATAGFAPFSKRTNRTLLGQTPNSHHNQCYVSTCDANSVSVLKFRNRRLRPHSESWSVRSVVPDGTESSAKTQHFRL